MRAGDEVIGELIVIEESNVFGAVKVFVEFAVMFPLTLVSTELPFTDKLLKEPCPAFTKGVVSVPANISIPDEV